MNDFVNYTKHKIKKTNITPTFIFIRNNNENKFTKKISFGRRPTKSSRRKLEKFMGRNF